MNEVVRTVSLDLLFGLSAAARKARPKSRVSGKMTLLKVDGDQWMLVAGRILNQDAKNRP
jgi:hypothetical protein